MTDIRIAQYLSLRKKVRAINDRTGKSPLDGLGRDSGRNFVKGPNVQNQIDSLLGDRFPVPEGVVFLERLLAIHEDALIASGVDVQSLEEI